MGRETSLTKSCAPGPHRAYLTYDYEVFFGRADRNQIDSLVVPTDILLEHLASLDVRATFFVDIGYLVRLRALQASHLQLGADLARVAEQLHRMCELGHDLQLHIHPHWEDATFDGQKWAFELARYRIHAFSDSDIEAIVNTYCAALNEFRSGSPATIFRAGGWCIQPFERLKGPLLRNGIHVDSTVYRGGFMQGGVQQFDFRRAPRKNIWRFDDDPCVEAAEGPFTEIPIAAHRFWPSAYWRVALGKLSDQPQHRQFIPGAPAKSGRMTLLKLMLLPSMGVVSLDGNRSRYLLTAWRRMVRHARHFVTLGHPKAISPYSLDRLAEFVKHVSPQLFGVLSEIAIPSRT
jgi:hypothetical protein